MAALPSTCGATYAVSEFWIKNAPMPSLHAASQSFFKAAVIFMRFNAKNLTTLIFCCGLTVWVFFLRWPYFDRPAWNLDEGIHATIARSILHGGVMYRDAIDQRTPLTYYLVAGIFRIFGENNMWAVHAILAGMVAATACGIFLIGRLWRSPAAGIWAALIFCAFSTNLFYIGDAFSLSTEWFLILFTTWSTWWFWRTWEQKSFWKPAAAGIGFAAAFLSKQPGLLDFGVPLATLLYLAASGRLRFSEAARQLAGLCTGFVAFTALVFAYFWVKGALDDFYFYAWSYNLLYYGPETSATDRVLAALGGLDIVRDKYPLIGIAVLAGACTRLLGLVQKRPDEAERAVSPAAFYVLTWALLSLAGSASAGRIYHHYYLQFLPALVLLAGWFLADCQERWQASSNYFLKGLMALVLAVSAWSVLAVPLRGPWPASLGPEAGTDAATYIRDHSKPSDQIFVWGYNPDFYLLADRRAASRYIYCSFLTGLIPWTNAEPGRDTSYAIVPGTMEILMRELAANRPKFIVDASLGEGRRFAKYPIVRFPQLVTFITSNYTEIEPVRFRAHGFRVLIRKDTAEELARLPSQATPAPEPGLDEPTVSAPSITDPVPVEVQIDGSHPTGRLQRLELLVNDLPLEGISFEPMARLSATVVVHFEKLGSGRHKLSVRATAANGETRIGQASEIECSPESRTAAQLAGFALPMSTTGPAPEQLNALYGPMATTEGGVRLFFVHAPSSMTYPLPATATRLSGRFGFRPGAYDANNAGHTDGAEFSVTLIAANGQRTELMRRLLRPWEEPADRGEQNFAVDLPGPGKNRKIELKITNGLLGNSASDWTYWSDLLLNTSQ